MTAVLRHLLARYDSAALQPPVEMAGRPGAAEQSGFDALRRWCLADSPHVALAVLHDAEPARASRLATQLALERDGSWQLAACSGALARLQLRSLTKLRDVLPWRSRQDKDPWDSGWLRDSPQSRQALACFNPRRATLIVADGLPPESAEGAWQTLRSGQARYAHPVRLLLVGPAPAWALILKAPVFSVQPHPFPP